MINRNRLIYLERNESLTGSLHAFAIRTTIELAHRHNQLCVPHGERLRRRLDEVGLGDFIPPTDEEAIRRNTLAHHHGLKRDTYDPENLALASLVGYAAWKVDLPAQTCPLCHLGDLAPRALDEATNYQRLIAEHAGFFARN